MSARTVVLMVVKNDGCAGVLKPGDVWVFAEREVRAGQGVKLCARAVCSLYPRLKDWLHEAPAAPAPTGEFLACGGEGCGAVFQAKDGTAGALAAHVPERLTRRLERRALESGTQLLEAGPFLTRISPETAARLVVACLSRKHRDGETILQENVVGERLFIVGDGEVEITRHSALDAAETVLAVLGMGDCFGEMSLLTGEPTSASARARGPTVILSLTRDQLEEQLAASPELNRVFSKLLADRLRAVNVTLENELGRGFKGKLSMVSIMDLVQTLHTSRRTGTLRISGRGREALVNFHNGLVTAAVTGETRGAEAFYELFHWPDGDFSLEAQQTLMPDDAQVGVDTMALLMEGLRRMDEQKRQAPSS